MTTKRTRLARVTAPASVSRRALVRALPGLALVTASGGCSLFSGANKPAPKKFWLASNREFPPDLVEVDWQLMIKPVTASMGLDTVRIARRGHSPYLIEYFDGAVWSETAPQMIQMLLLEAFEESDKIKAVGHEETGLLPDYILQLDLRDFTVNATSSNTGFVSVNVGVHMIALETASIVDSRRFKYNEYYGGTAIENQSRRKKQKTPDFHIYVEAFSRATATLCTEIVTWSLSAGNLHYQQKLAELAAQTHGEDAKHDDAEH